MRQILTIGGIDLELILTIPQIPRPDEKVLGNFIGRLPGGPAANFACAASRLGLDVAAHCQVGDDEGGRLIIDQLETYGVDTSLVEVMLGQATPFALILVDPSGEKMTITVPTFQATYSTRTIAPLLPEIQILYIMPDNEQTFLTLAQTAHTHDTEVMIAIEPDVCRNRNKLERILSQTDIASFNQFGFRAAAGVEPSVEAAQSLLAYGPHTVIVTLGEQGALAVNRDGAVVQPGLNVPVADTIGAGDTFNAAFIRAYLDGKSLAEAVQFANVAAALSVTALGPRGLLPKIGEVEAFLANLI